jgi:hypothetical protein
MEAVGLLHSKAFKLLLSYIIDLANVLSNSTRKTQGFQFSSLSQVFFFFCRVRGYVWIFE